MKQKHSILSVFIAISLCAPSITFAVDFGPSSAKITNQYYPADVGDWKYKLGDGNWTGRITYINAVGVEEVSGAQIGAQTFNNINCLKVNMIMAKQNDEDDFITIWMAQDTEGNLWLLKIYIFPDDETILLGTQFKSMFMPAVPTIGDSASITIPEDVNNYCEVAAVNIPITTNYGSYTGCIQTRCFHDSPPDEVEYYCPDVGEVRASTVSNPSDVIDLKEYGTAKETRAAVIPLMN
jgi:hypothetical protein